MEQLNKSQIVLLTLLVSFVTSIATGIVTVSLMEQAPPVIPQTINRVVERTVERVVPHETQTATVITTEKTVVVKEADLISQAVARVRPSVVRVTTKGTEAKAGEFLARGFVIADTYAVSSFPGAKADMEVVVLIGDKTIPAKVMKVDAESGVALLGLTEADKEHTPVATLNPDAVTLGATIVAITGASSLKVASGIVTAANETTLETGEVVQSSFEINVPADTLVSGGALLNTDGAVIGMYAGDEKMVPASYLGALASSLVKSAEKEVAEKDAKNPAKTGQ